MIGPTGVGKTEIARRLARLAGSPFLKVEASKFTEVGYVGRDVESIVRDLVERGDRHGAPREAAPRSREKAERARRGAPARPAPAAGPPPRPPTRGPAAAVSRRARRAVDDAREAPRAAARRARSTNAQVEVEVEERGGAGVPDPGRPGRRGDGRQPQGHASGALRRPHGSAAAAGRARRARRSCGKSEEARLVDQEQVAARPSTAPRRTGIVFLDEIDKIAGRERRHGPDVSREGVQRDLLPIVEGTTVTTKYGPVRTDHILFIAAGAFHVSKPIRPHPRAPGPLPDPRRARSRSAEDDFVRILTEPRERAHQAVPARSSATEGVALRSPPTRSREIARFAAAGQRRDREHRRAPARHDARERCSRRSRSRPAGTWRRPRSTIDAADVRRRLEPLVSSQDLSRSSSDPMQTHAAAPRSIALSPPSRSAPAATAATRARRCAAPRRAARGSSCRNGGTRSRCARSLRPPRSTGWPCEARDGGPLGGAAGTSRRRLVRRKAVPAKPGRRPRDAAAPAPGYDGPGARDRAVGAARRGSGPDHRGPWPPAPRCEPPRELTAQTLAEDGVAPRVAGGPGPARPPRPPRRARSFRRRPGRPGREPPQRRRPRPAPPPPRPPSTPPRPRPSVAGASPSRPPAPSPRPRALRPRSPPARGRRPRPRRRARADSSWYRRLGGEPYDAPLVEEPLERRTLRDTLVPAGTRACYVVRAVGSPEPLIESGPSDEVCVVRRDVAPPAAPAGIAIVARAGGLELIWSPSPEPDLAGYRVFRVVAGGTPQKLAELDPARTSYLDASAQPGVATATRSLPSIRPATRAPPASRSRRRCPEPALLRHPPGRGRTRRHFHMA